MHSGATRGAGGPALGSHVANADANEHVEAGPSRGLVADTITGQVAELTRLGSHARTRQPIYHVHLDPPADRPFTPEERARYWERFEEEFGLQGQPFASQIHVKDGREHEHREYLRTRPDGTAIRLDHDFARREKLSRIMEWERGEPFTKGAHNRAAIAALEKDGREDLADAMRAAGLHEGPRPRAAVTPAERLQQDRTGISKRDVAASVAQAWAASDSGSAFAAALAEQGLRLAHGDKCAVIVDSTGNTHSLVRMLAMDARATGTDVPKAAAVAARLDGLALPGVSDARKSIAAQAPPDNDGTPSPEAPTPPGGQAAPSRQDAPRANAPALVSHGGNALAPSPVQVAPGAMLEDAGPGPGEPPGPGAHPDELARYCATLHAHAERKERALQAFMRATAAASDAGHQAATTGGGGHHGTVQHVDGWQRWWPEAVNVATAAGYTAEEARRAVRAAGLDAHARRLACERDGYPGPHGSRAEPGRDGPGSSEDTGHLRPGEGGKRQQQPGREPPATDDGARAGGEQILGRGEGVADGHRGQAGDAGRQACPDGSTVHRAARSLHTLDLAALRDRLNPARVAAREARSIRDDISSRRAAVPAVPRTAWEQREGEVMDRTILALDRVMERVDARDSMTLSAIREHGFPEVLREEELRVLLDEDQAVRAVDSAGGPRAAERWTPPTR